MAAMYTGPQNVFIPDHAASGKLVVDFSRNLKKFAIARWAQIIPVQKTMGYYLRMTLEEAARILQSDGSNMAWPDGADRPKGEENLESHEFLPFLTKRFAPTVPLGDLTVDNATWDLIAHYAGIRAHQAMTLRTVKTVAEAVKEANYAASHVVDVTADIDGHTGAWGDSTTARLDIKAAFNYAANRILLDTLNGVSLDDLMVVINPTLAREMAESQEITEYLKGSPDAKAMQRGEGKNVMFGLPDRLYGFPIEVEATVKITSHKGATANNDYVLPTATPFMCARPGGLEGVANTPNFATHVLFMKEELTVETLKDVNNRKTVVSVVEDYAPVTVAPVSGVMFKNVS